MQQPTFGPILQAGFFVGILFAGIITVLVPDDMIASYLGGGAASMLLMPAFGIPLYICATASTPIAAAFIMKGVSPGTALVFLLVGPATNVTSLSVLIGLLGKRATVLYLASIAVVSVLCGLAVDAVYISLGIPAVAVVNQAGEVLPGWLMTTTTLLLLALSIRPLSNIVRGWFGRAEGCGCSSGSCATDDDNSHSYVQNHNQVYAGATGVSCCCGSSCRTSDSVQLQPLMDLNEGKKVLTITFCDAGDEAHGTATH